MPSPMIDPKKPVMSNVQEQVQKAVETTKEAAAKMTEQVSDFFQGNPFSTPVGRKIEQATDASALATENWGLNMEICDFINSSEEYAKDAVRAIKKRLHSSMSKNNAVVMYTLTVLETRDFVNDLVRLIGPKYDAPQIIQERVLGLIQAWADAFKDVPDLQGVQQVYEDYKSKGVEFPAADLDNMAPILTPKQTVFPEPGEEHRAQNPSVVGHANMTYQVAPPAAGPIEANPEQLAKLRKDLDMVHSNLKVFRELLTEVIPGKETAEELQLISDLNSTCKQMQTRVLDLIRAVTNEEVTQELLAMNDEFNTLFEKHDRFATNRTNPQAAAAAPQNSADLLDFGNGSNLGDQLAGMRVTTASSSYAANSEPQTSMGLATAVQNKIPSEVEAAEMASWLDAQGKQEKTKEDLENDKL